MAFCHHPKNPVCETEAEPRETRLESVISGLQTPVPKVCLQGGGCELRDGGMEPKGEFSSINPIALEAGDVMHSLQDN